MTSQTSKTSQTKKSSATSPVDLIEDQGMAAAELCVRVADVLNLALDQSGRSQKDLADRLGIGESRVSQVLRGDGNVHIATLGRFLRGIGYKAKLVLEAADDDVPAFIEPQPKKRRAKKAAPKRGFGYTHVIRQPYLDGSGASYAITVLQSAEKDPNGWMEQATEVVTVNSVTGETHTRKMRMTGDALGRRVGEPALFDCSTEAQDERAVVES